MVGLKRIVLLCTQPRPRIQSALSGECVIVDSIPRLGEELAKNHVDVVIADTTFDPAQIHTLTAPANIPAVIVAENGDVGQAVTALKAGMRDYIIMDDDFQKNLTGVIDQLPVSVSASRNPPAIISGHDIYDNAPVMMFTFNRDGTILDANKHCLQELGYDRNRLIGYSLRTFLTSAAGQSDPISLGRLWQAGHADELALQCRTHSARMIEVLVDCRVLRDSQAAVAVMRTIRDQKRAKAVEDDQQALSDALRDTTVALNSTLDFDEVLDRILANVARVVPYDTGVVMFVDDNKARLVRNQRWTELGREINVPHVELPIDEMPTMRRMYQTGQPLAIPDTALSPDWVDLPQSRWVHSFVGAPIREGEKIIGFLTLNSGKRGTFTDKDAERLQAFANQAAIAIRNARLFDAAQRHAEELEQRVAERTAQLNVERNQLHAILESTGEGLFFAENHTIQYVNPALTAMTGFPAQDILGKSLKVFSDTEEETWKAMQSTVQQGKVWRADLRLRRKDGSAFDAGVTIAPGSQPGAQSLRTVAVVRDISREKALQDQKARFIANASHELRTPIQNIITRLYLIKHRPTQADEHIEVIKTVTERMRKLVEDLLDLSRFDHGVIPIQKHPVYLQGLIQTVVEVQRAEAQTNGIHLVAQMTADPLYMLGDSERLGQVITNLVMNALNYTPEDGTVTISLNQKEEHAIICVTDTGVGIDAARIDQIFEPFVRINENRKGSGLGLSIAKEIVEMHDGTIEVTSTPGQGSCFELTFVLASVAAER